MKHEINPFAIEECWRDDPTGDIEAERAQTERDAEFEADVIDVEPCSLCKAKRGQPCTDRRGKRLAQPHQIRIDEGGWAVVGEYPDEEFAAEHSFILGGKF